MSKLILALSLLISSASFAATLADVDAEYVSNSVNFSYYNNNAHYSCFYVQGQATKYLKALNAKNVITKCSGGIQGNVGWIPVNLRVSFDSLQVVDTATKTSVKAAFAGVVFKGSDSCEVNVKLLNALLPSFDVEVTAATNTCWNFEGRYNYELSTLKAL